MTHSIEIKLGPWIEVASLARLFHRDELDIEHENGIRWDWR